MWPFRGYEYYVIIAGGVGAGLTWGPFKTREEAEAFELPEGFRILASVSGTYVRKIRK